LLRSNNTASILAELRNKPFWIWNVQEHKQEDVITNGDCCFNHIIGLPTKDGIEKAMFDYEKILYDALLDNHDSIHVFKYKHVWVKKAAGLGISEFMLWFMAWLCL
jgi:hypothetical protein